MTYTPGYSARSTAFMARRSLATHGAFVRPLLRPGLCVLDLGCGPGAIALDLARAVAPGRVLGVDRAESQVAAAREAAAAAGLANVEFRAAEADAIPADAGAFDLVFSHALFEHLSDPVAVLKKLRPLVRPGGHLALRSPDWGGFVLHPESPALADAIAAYGRLQRANGGDIHAGRKLASWLAEAGCEDIQRSASYEIYPAAELIADYLAEQLTAAGDPAHAATLRVWSREPHALFAQSWFEAIGRKGSEG